MTERRDSSGNDISCSAVASLAFEFLDGEMPPQQQVAVQGHMGRCPPCRQHLERERSFLDTLRASLAGERCPDVVRERIREAMRQRREARSGR